MAGCKVRSPDRELARFVVGGCLVTMLLCIWVTASAYANETRRVLILNSNQSFTYPTRVVDAAIRQNLHTAFPDIEVFNEFLDEDRFPEPTQHEEMATFLRERYAGRRFDLVIATGTPALEFLLLRRAFLFPGSQLLFVGNALTGPSLNSLPPDISRIITRYNPKPTVDLALRLQPNAKRVVVVVGDTDSDRRWAAATRRELSAFANRLDIVFWSGVPMADLLRDVSRLPDQTFVLYLEEARDKTGQTFLPEEVARKLAAAARVPVYGLFDQQIGLGVVGGNMITYEDIGRETGELARRIMTTHRSGIRLLTEANNIVDWGQVQRWRLSEANLPPSTVVRFRQPSLWEEHKWAVIGAVTALVLQSLLIAALIVQGQRRQRAQAALAEQQAALAEQQQELAHLGRVSLLGELSGAIAHEINNPLTAILSNAQAAKRFLLQKPANTGEVGEILDDIAADSKRAGNVIQRLRALFKKAETRLEPVDLNGIVADVLELADRRLLEDNVSVTTKLAADVPAVRADPVQLKQVFLNLVINACDAMAENKPADRSLTIATSCEDQRFAQVSVSDRGSGIAPDVKERMFQPFVTTKSSGTGLGLSICRSIIVAHGGRLWASNNPDRGATFCVTLPTEGKFSQTVAPRGGADGNEAREAGNASAQPTGYGGMCG